MWDAFKKWMSEFFLSLWVSYRPYIVSVGAIILAVILLGLFVPSSRPYISWIGAVLNWVLGVLSSILNFLSNLFSVFGG